MKIIDMQMQVATVTSAASITLGPAVAPFRSVANAMAAGDIVANATDVRIMVVNKSDRTMWEMGAYTLNSDGTVLTQTARISSSNNGAAVNFNSATCDVYSTPDGKWLGKVLTTDDAIDLSALTLQTSTQTGDAVVMLRGTSAYLLATTALGAAPAADTTPPTFVSAQVANSTPTVVQVTMSEVLGSTPPPASALAVSKNGGSAVTVSSVTTGGSVMLVTVASAFVSTDTNIQVTYTKPSNGNMLTDAASTPNPAASFGPSAVTNNVSATPDTTKPTTVSAAVANATPTKVDITASEALNATYVPAASTFTVGGHAVSAVAVSGSVITLTVDAFVNGEAARNASYTPNGTNDIRDLAGNTMLAFSGLAITNNVQAAAPDYPQFIQLTNITQSGTGPYNYTGTANTNLSAARAMSVKKLPANGNGYLDMKVVSLPTSTEMIFGLVQGVTAVDWTAMPYGIYAKSASAYSIISNGAVTGAKDMTTSAAISISPAVGDILRVGRVDSTNYAKVSQDNGATWTTLYSWAAANAKDPGGPGVDLQFEILMRNSYSAQAIASSGLI